MDSTLEFHSSSEAETAEFGRTIAGVLQPGMTIALVGDLGAGKTRFVRAVCAGLGIDEADVTSPTFVLIQEYDGRWPVYHFDTYRLRDLDEFLELGPEEYFDSDGICMVEWADRVAEALPADHLRVEIAITGETSRCFTATSSGPVSNSVLNRLSDT